MVTNNILKKYKDKWNFNELEVYDNTGYLKVNEVGVKITFDSLLRDDNVSIMVYSNGQISWLKNFSTFIEMPPESLLGEIKHNIYQTEMYNKRLSMKAKLDYINIYDSLKGMFFRVEKVLSNMNRIEFNIYDSGLSHYLLINSTNLFGVYEFRVKGFERFRGTMDENINSLRDIIKFGKKTKNYALTIYKKDR